MGAGFVSLRGVNKFFDDVHAVANLDLDVHAGEFFSMLGPSGSGKTTVLRLIAGFESASTGTISIESQDVTELAPFDRPVNTVFQDYALFPHMSIQENVEYGLRTRKVPRPERAKQALEAIDSVKLSHLSQRLPHQLSGGQRQRIALARALVLRPKVLLLDEPLGALDKQLREEMQVELKRIQREAGITFIFVTHDQEEALSIADRVAVLRDGEIAQVGSPRDIYSEPADIGIATFLGDSVIVDGVVEGGKIVTSLGQLTPLNQVFEGARGKVAIRPENFYLQPNVKGDAVVVNRQFFGHDAVVEVKTPQTTVRARASGPFAPEIGMKVTVWVRGAVNFYAE